MWQNGTKNWWRFSSYFYLKKWLSGNSTYILPKYDGQIIEIEKDENRNMCSWCTLHISIHLCYTTIVLKEGYFLPTSFEVILAFTLSMLCLKINWQQRKKVTSLKVVFELLMLSVQYTFIPCTVFVRILYTSWHVNSTVNAVLLRVPFIIYHKITLNIPFKLFFLVYYFSPAPLLFKIGTFCVLTEVESGLGILSQNRDCPA